MRRAALSYCPPFEQAMLDQMLALMINSTSKASTAIDHMLEFVDASNRRIAEMGGGVSGQPDRR
jgi:hypothetical protein